MHAEEPLENIRAAGEGVDAIEGQRAGADFGQRAANAAAAAPS